MINKTILSMLMVAIMFGTTISMNAQEDSNDYKMWEDVMLTPDNTKLKVLADNMRKHNQMYHAEGPYKAVVYNIASGPNAGNIIWEMGPMKYKHNDTRPGEGGLPDLGHHLVTHGASRPPGYSRRRAHRL